MRSLNPFSGATYVEALQMSRITREMFCLMEGRHVHPSTIYPGGVGTVPTPQLFTDYLVRLMRCIDWVKKIVPITDDLFDFFYDVTGGEYGKVGYRRTLLGCWGAFQNPDVVNYTYEGMNDAGNGSFVTPGIVVDGELVTTNLVDINLGLRILLGSSFYDDWQQEEPFVTRDPLGNPVDQRHPWNQTTLPKPQKRDFDKNYSWVMSPRWYDERTGDHLALDTGGGPLARLWATALAGLVDTGYVKATGSSVEINLPGTSTMPETSFEWKIPEQGSNTLERGRARAYFIAYSAAQAVYFVEKALELVRAGDTKAANYHPYPPTPWNGSPTDSYGTPGPYEDAVQNTPIFEENGPDNFKGIDIMRAVRSFDPCLPCGVHMYTGKGGVKKVQHTP